VTEEEGKEKGKDVKKSRSYENMADI